MLTAVNIGAVESPGSPKRRYHHGDLRNALVDAAVELAARGGPTSITIRAAARLVGVTPTAAYRHFAGHEELLEAAKQRALDALSDAMNKELGDRVRGSDPVRSALGDLAALGCGYIAFSRAERGMFNTLFAAGGPTMRDVAEHRHGPFQLLLEALDALVEVGYLEVRHRPLAEVSAWATIHGMAMLLDGPLRDLTQEARDAAVAKAMAVFIRGLSSTGMTAEQEAFLAEEISGL